MNNSTQAPVAFCLYNAAVLLVGGYLLSRFCTFFIVRVLAKLACHQCCAIYAGKAAEANDSPVLGMFIIAHRGFSSKYPGNSMISFQKALEAGSNGIELDIRVCSDSVIVVCHDDNPITIRNENPILTKIEESPSSEIRALRYRNGTARHPLLQDVFQLCHSKRVMILLDVKSLGTSIIEKAVHLAMDGGVIDQIVLGIRTLEQLVKAKELQTRHGLKFKILGFWPDPDDYLTFFSRGGTIFRLWEDDATPARIKAIRGLDRPVWVCTGTPLGDSVDGRAAGEVSRAGLRRLQELGVQAVLVNNPEEVQEVLLEHWTYCYNP